MSNKIFSYTVTIQQSHLDLFGHVNNAAYFVLLEDARWDFITKNGYGVKKIQETQLGPTILEINIRFLKELCFQDEIVIKTTMIGYKNKIGKLSQKMLRGNDVCCEAEYTLALFDIKARKLVLPTQEWLIATGIEE